MNFRTKIPILFILFLAVWFAGSLESRDPAFAFSGGSGEGQTDKKIQKIDQEIDKVENKIEKWRQKLNAIDMDMNQRLGVGGSLPLGKTIGGNIQSVYDSPRSISHLQNDRIYVINKLDDLEKEKKKLITKKSSLLNEKRTSCFSPDTLVALPGNRFEKIRNLKPGDQVLVYDMGKDRSRPSRVNKVFRSTNNHFYIINDQLRVTAFERLLTPDGWKRVIRLRPSDKIFDGTRFVEIHKIEKIRGDFTVYNLNIAETHNFIVSSDGVHQFVVHNTAGGHGDGGGGK